VTEAAPDAGDEQLAATARETSISPGQAVLSGFRQPVVAVLLLIALCTAISGKPLDGALMAAVASLLVFDSARTRLTDAGPELASTARGDGQPSSARPISGRHSRTWAGLAVITACGLYAVFVGSFSRYSWPATVAVVAVGCLVVGIGWQGPLRQRAALTGTAQRRSWLWGVIVVVGGSWELSSLLQQPHLTTDSYAHPTISALTDPLLGGHPGRSLVLAGWLFVGWLLVER
jgi:hypothetical protein